MKLSFSGVSPIFLQRNTKRGKYSMNINEFMQMKEKAADILSVKLDYDFAIFEKEGIYVSFSGSKAVIGGKEKTDYYRGLMLLALGVKEGKKEFEIKEKRHFDTLGFSLDLSRNGVIKVSKIKEIIDVMALLGFNVLKIYMEDVFELPGYPHFGYRRGRYSHTELKEIDDYAYSMGVEVIPAIQTLGHLGQYLRYYEAIDFRENSNVLLCGEEKTYEFIDALIGTIRSCFRSKRLVINCDEAAGVGIKQIMREKKYVSPYDISIKHVSRVLDICEKYDFRPCVHGDLFYGYLGNGYYDFEFDAKKEEIEKIPDIDIIFWDYYHTGYDDYDTLLKGHRSLGKNTLFMGGIWTWAGQLPNVEFTFNTMKPAMECCLNNNVRDVWAATFGDDGNETNIDFALPMLTIFSEYCFEGEKCTDDWIKKLINDLFGIDFEDLWALSDYHYPFVEGYTREDYIFPNYMGKKILYTDILYNMTGTYDYSEILPKHKKALEQLEKCCVPDRIEKYRDYSKKIFEITVCKMELIPKLKTAYLNKNKEELKNISEIVIPELITKYKELMLIHENQWMDTYKVNGWEELNNRYTGVIGRLEYAIRVIGKYLRDEINIIEELECEFIEEMKNTYCAGRNVALYSNLKSTGI